MSRVNEFDKCLSNKSFLEATLIALGAAVIHQQAESKWLRKMYAAVIQSDDKMLVDSITQILNAANPTDYKALKNLVMEAIINK